MKNKKLWISLILSLVPLMLYPNQNIKLYWAGEKAKDGTYNGVGLIIDGKNYEITAKYAKELKQISAIYITKFKDKLKLKSWASYLHKGFKYKNKHYHAHQLKLGFALLYTDSKTYNITIGQIESILKNLGYANTTSHITFINWAYKPTGKNFDISASFKNVNVYGKNSTQFLAWAQYYLSKNLTLGAKYNSHKLKKSNYKIRAGIEYKFGKKTLTPYLNSSYNVSKHTLLTLNYENNIANKPIYFNDEFATTINSSTITAKEYNLNKFNKKLDKNIRAKNQTPIANNDFATVQEGQSYNINVLNNDFDPEKNQLRITKITDVNGDFSIVSNQIQFKAEKPGEFSCNYTISDWQEEFAKTATAKLTVKVTAKKNTENNKPCNTCKPDKPKPTPEPVNHAPVAQDFTEDAIGRNTYTVDISPYISDPDWDFLEVSVLSAWNELWDLEWITTNVNWTQITISVTGWTWHAKIIYKVDDWKWWTANATVIIKNLDWE